MYAEFLAEVQKRFSPITTPPLELLVQSMKESATAWTSLAAVLKRTSEVGKQHDMRQEVIAAIRRVAAAERHYAELASVLSWPESDTVSKNEGQGKRFQNHL